MHDRNEDEIVTIDDSVQRLKTVAFLLKGLYGQLAEEREAITLASGQMAHAVKQFQNHLTQFEAFEKSCRQTIVDTVKNDLRQSAKLIAHEISQQVAATVNDPVEKSLSNLRQLSERAGLAFDQQVREVSRIKLWVYAIVLSMSLACGLIGGLVVHYYFPETNEITNRQMLWGSVLMNAVPHLSKQEKDKIIKLGIR